ncbi:MAG: hypothetical protein AAGI88_22460 [Pseudomonadota bacterium]
MRSSDKYAVWVVRFAVAALLLQVAVPRGFMPADIDTGWYLKFCPQGLPASALKTTSPEHHLHRRLHDQPHPHLSQVKNQNQHDRQNREHRQKSGEHHASVSGLCAFAAQLSDGEASPGVSFVQALSVSKPGAVSSLLQVRRLERTQFQARAPPHA